MVVDDADAVYEYLVGRGVAAEPVVDFPWGRFTFFADPDGNRWAVQQMHQAVGAVAAIRSSAALRICSICSGVRPRPSTIAAGDPDGGRPHRPAGVGHDDVERALVVGGPLAPDEPHGLQPLDQRRRRGRLEVEQRGEVLERQPAVLPEGEHREVLRVRQPERLEQRTVERDQAAGRGGHGQADLGLDGERIVHAADLRSCAYS